MKKKEIETTEQLKNQIRKALSFSYFCDFEKPTIDNSKKPIYVGRRNKAFYMVDKDYFSPLFDELRNNPKCSYITYQNNIIKNGFIPKEISCVIKKLHGNTPSDALFKDRNLVCSEVLASQILNYYECPTPYNVAVKANNGAQKKDTYELMSVNMTSANFYTLDDYNCKLGNMLNSNVSNIIENLSNTKLFKQCFNEDYTKLINFVDDYIYSFLVRKYVLQDGDFYQTNAGILTNTFQYANIDFEYSFDESKQSPYIIKNFKYVRDNYPHIFEKFTNKSEQLFRAVIELTKNKEIDYSSETHHEHINMLLYNLREVVNVATRLDFYTK